MAASSSAALAQGATARAPGGRARSSHASSSGAPEPPPKPVLPVTERARPDPCKADRPRGAGNPGCRTLGGPEHRDGCDVSDACDFAGGGRGGDSDGKADDDDECSTMGGRSIDPSSGARRSNGEPQNVGRKTRYRRPQTEEKPSNRSRILGLQAAKTQQWACEAGARAMAVNTSKERKGPFRSGVEGQV